MPELHEFEIEVWSLALQAQRRFRVLDREAFYQHGLTFLWQHRDRINRWYDDDPTNAPRRVSRMLAKAMEQLGKKEKAYRAGYHPEDQAHYSTGMVEELLPVLFDPTLADAAPVTERAEVSGPNDPAIQPLWPIHVIDMRRAWEGADLTVRERGMLGMRYGDNASLADIARAYEVGEAELERGLKRSLRRLVDVLGGESPRTCERDCQDCKS